MHALHSFPPESHGGIETYVLMLAGDQAAAGHSVRVLAGSDRQADAVAARGERVDGVPLMRVQAPAGLPWPLGETTRELQEAIDAELDPSRTDVLHVHHWHNLAGDLVRRARQRGIGVVVTLHDLYASCPLFFRVPAPGLLCPPDLPRAQCARCVGSLVDQPQARLWEALAERERSFQDELAAAHRVLVLSEPQRELLAQVPWLSALSLQVLPLPAPAVPAPRVGWQPQPGRLRIVCWGGLVPGKGLHVLLEACERLPFAEHVVLDHHGHVHDEAYAGQLRQRARRVRFALCGRYGDRELAEVFPAYDVMVFPSLYLETHGFVVDEAMALGLPVVVTDRGAPQHRIGGRGIVVPANDCAALAGVLAELYADPKRLAALRAAVPPALPSRADHVAAVLAAAATASGQQEPPVVQ